MLLQILHALRAPEQVNNKAYLAFLAQRVSKQNWSDMISLADETRPLGSIAPFLLASNAASPLSHCRRQAESGKPDKPAQ